MSVGEPVIVLNFGQVIAEGRPEEVQRDPAVVEAYLGTSNEEGEDGRDPMHRRTDGRAASRSSSCAACTSPTAHPSAQGHHLTVGRAKW